MSLFPIIPPLFAAIQSFCCFVSLALYFAWASFSRSKIKSLNNEFAAWDCTYVVYDIITGSLYNVPSGSTVLQIPTMPFLALHNLLPFSSVSWICSVSVFTTVAEPASYQPERVFVALPQPAVVLSAFLYFARSIAKCSSQIGAFLTVSTHNPNTIV